MIGGRLFFGILLTLLVTASSQVLAASGDVTIKINGGNVAYIGEVNKLEIWITNDIPLGGLQMPFGTEWGVSYQWIKPYGDRPVLRKRVQAYGDAMTAFEWSFGVNDRNDNSSPDSMILYGVGVSHLLPVHEVSTKLYDLAFYIEPWQAEVLGGICVDNITSDTPPDFWEFTDEMGLIDFAPTFQGNPNTSTVIADAPPVCFDVAQRPYVKGDANLSGSSDISDAVYLINFAFAGGPMPVPFQAGDANCDQTVDISDVVYMIEWIFGGGPAPC